MPLKNLFLSILLIAMAVTASGKGIDKMYVQKNSDNGWMFHVFSQKMPCIHSTKKVKDIRYDYTYLQSNDSVTILSTIILEDSEKPLDLVIDYAGEEYRSEVRTVYVDSKKNNFVYRLKAQFPFSVWEKMYAGEAPLTLTYSFGNDGIKKESHTFSNIKNWTNTRSNMNKIIDIIKLNIGK